MERGEERILLSEAKNSLFCPLFWSPLLLASLNPKAHFFSSSSSAAACPRGAAQKMAAQLETVFLFPQTEHNTHRAATQAESRSLGPIIQFIDAKLTASAGKSNSNLS